MKPDEAQVKILFDLADELFGDLGADIQAGARTSIEAHKQANAVLAAAQFCREALDKACGICGNTANNSCDRCSKSLCPNCLLVHLAICEGEG